MSKEQGQQHDQGKPAEFAPITSQEDLDKVLERERGKFADYDAVKEKASRFDELQEQSKTELQRATERADAEAKRAEAATTELLRLTVAHEKGLTPAQAKRLVGATKDDLEKDAEQMLADFASVTRKTTPTARPARLASGSAADKAGGESKAAAALRAMRQG